MFWQEPRIYSQHLFTGGKIKAYVGAGIRIAIRRGIIRIERRETRISAIIRIATRVGDTPAGELYTLKKSPRFARMR